MGQSDIRLQENYDKVRPKEEELKNEKSNNLDVSRLEK